MATIEPRLIHLLNDSTTPELPNSDLPPSHSLPYSEPPDGPLPPLDRESAHHGDRGASDFLSRPVPLHLAGELEGPLHRVEEGHLDGVFAGNTDGYPMRILSRDPDAHEALHPLSKLLDEGPDALSDDSANKKRNRGLVRDEYLQLPQPIKKQKPAIPTSVMPPIINGLHEPPPHAALFPPIASTSFHEAETNQFQLVPDSNNVSDDQSNRKTTPEAEKGKGRKRATKPRRKWSEEETNHLLLGVSKYGVGKWTTILEDRDFKFDNRSAGDLKDRFRTCCPDELRASKGEKKSITPTRPPQQKPKKGLHAENILHEDDIVASPGLITPPTDPENIGLKGKKPRAHRKKLEDLENLGIHGPFKKSLRRERRPFTDQDDREILEGLERYGPAWTKIQRDATFNLSSRQPTDLRDRVRNKYPDTYKRIEKGTYQGKDVTRRDDVMEPSVSTSMDRSLKMKSQMSRTDSREDLSRNLRQFSDPNDRNSTAHGSDVGDLNVSHGLGGEMGISRLLLDDPN